jgi:hypothetical protein
MNTIPQGLRFADEESESNCRKALEGELNQWGFRPIVIINSSSPRSGKTTLARHILETRYNASVIYQMPVQERQWVKLMPTIIEAGYLFCDGVSGHLDSNVLAEFLVAKDWTWRNPRTHEMKSAKVDCQVIITGNAISISADLARRAIFIELLPLPLA